MVINLRLVYNFLNAAVPKNGSGDILMSWINFVGVHKRLPKRRGGSLNDALYYQKISDAMHEPLRTFVTDKEFLKDYVRVKVGAEHVVPTIAILTGPDEARRYDYPENCVIKPTHLSGHVIIRHGNEPIEFEYLLYWFKINQYENTRERNYKNLNPKIIDEPIIFGELFCDDYKVFCVNGHAKMIEVDTDRFEDHRRNYYSPGWDALDFGIKIPLGPLTPRPANLSRLVALAEEMAADFPFVRVDLYTNGEAIYVGELTFCHENASGRFTSPAGEAHCAEIMFDGIKGDYLTLAARTTGQAPAFPMHART